MPPRNKPPSQIPSSRSQNSNSQQSASQLTQSKNCAGRPAGAQGFSASDMMILSQVVATYRPLGAQEWDSVQQAYNEYSESSGRQFRTIDSLRNKFKTLVNHSKPTGDPDCPEYVQIAKRAQRKIKERATFLLVNDDGVDNDEDEEEEMNTTNLLADEPNTNHLSQSTMETGQTHLESIVNTLGLQIESETLCSKDTVLPDVDTLAINSQASVGTGLNTTSNSTSSRSPQPPPSSLSSTQTPWPPPSMLSALATLSKQTFSTNQSAGKNANDSARNKRPQSNLQDLMTGYYHPNTIEKRENKHGMVNFYMMALQESNANVKQLESDKERLHLSLTQMQNNLAQLQDEVVRLREEKLRNKGTLNFLRQDKQGLEAENRQIKDDLQELKGKLDRLQSKYEILELQLRLPQSTRK